MKLNLGCGATVVDGWVNVDYSLGAKLSKVPLFTLVNKRLGIFSLTWDNRIFLHDLTQVFPWDPATVDYCYSSHTLEHLTREQGLFFLRETFRVLKSGGIIRIVVPDLASMVRKYLSGEIRADHFLEEMGVLYGTQKMGLKKILSPFYEFPHKCMYDTPTLMELMAEVGFAVAKRDAFDSQIPRIDEIEIRERAQDAVIVEATKR